MPTGSVGSSCAPSGGGLVRSADPRRGAAGCCRAGSARRRSSSSPSSPRDGRVAARHRPAGGRRAARSRPPWARPPACLRLRRPWRLSPGFAPRGRGLRAAARATPALSERGAGHQPRRSAPLAASGQQCSRIAPHEASSSCVVGARRSSAAPHFLQNTASGRSSLAAGALGARRLVGSALSARSLRSSGASLRRAGFSFALGRVRGGLRFGSPSAVAVLRPRRRRGLRGEGAWRRAPRPARGAGCASSSSSAEQALRLAAVPGDEHLVVLVADLADAALELEVLERAEDGALLLFLGARRAERVGVGAGERRLAERACARSPRRWR